MLKYFDRLHKRPGDRSDHRAFGGHDQRLAFACPRSITNLAQGVRTMSERVEPINSLSGWAMPSHRASPSWNRLMRRSKRQRPRRLARRRTEKRDTR